MKEPKFTVGIEEEYMVVDRETGDLIQEAPRSLMPALKRKLKKQVSPEFLQCQVEVGTKVCSSIKEARENIGYLRRSVSDIVEEHGFALIAVSTHPFAADHKAQTRKPRYQELAQDLQGVVRRMIISGMHVHVGIEDADLRIDLMNQAAYILPHLLALSTSSPFWKGQDSGLKSYRIAVWNEMPRTGLPESFQSYGEYRRHVDVLVDAGIIEDATKIWWDLRPSERYDTLELRITDICTRVDDGVCIAALYVCWLRMLYRLRHENKSWRRYASMLVNENRWRAHRYGTDEGLIDFGRGEVVSYAELYEEMLVLLKEDAQFLDCLKEIRHARKIIKNGTSAHRQIRTYNHAIENGKTTEQATKAVVDMLIKDTLIGV